MSQHWLFTSALIVIFALALPFLSYDRTHNYSSIGRKNTVLFIADSASGLSNVHLATAYSLSKQHPSVEIHYASFPKRKDALQRLSSIAISQNPSSQSIKWHELPGPDLSTAVLTDGAASIITPPGLAGIEKMATSLISMLNPFHADQYETLYRTTSNLIETINPAVVVVEPFLGPCIDAVRDLNRLHTIVSPNALADFFSLQQPWGAMFWKYPPMGSGLPFPIPWKLIPYSIYYQARFLTAYALGLLRNPRSGGSGVRGRKHKTGFLTAYRSDVPWLSASTIEAGLPLVIPINVTTCGPIVLDTTDLEEIDTKLFQWLKNAPTILINLGSLMKYDEARAIAMAQAVSTLLSGTKFQVLWKFDKLGSYGDTFLEHISGYVKNGRLRIENWLKPDPFMILQSGCVVAFVHHGGANCFNEAILAGIPQIILPLWYDLYNYAQLVEYLGVGVWPGKERAPEWEAKDIFLGFENVLNLETGRSIRLKAAELGATARTYDGKECAAGTIAALASTGK